MPGPQGTVARAAHHLERAVAVQVAQRRAARHRGRAELRPIGEWTPGRTHAPDPAIGGAEEETGAAPTTEVCPGEPAHRHGGEADVGHRVTRTAVEHHEPLGVGDEGHAPWRAGQDQRGTHARSSGRRGRRDRRRGEETLEIEPPSPVLTGERWILRADIVRRLPQPQQHPHRVERPPTERPLVRIEQRHRPRDERRREGRPVQVGVVARLSQPDAVGTRRPWLDRGRRHGHARRGEIVLGRTGRERGDRVHRVGRRDRDHVGAPPQVVQAAAVPPCDHDGDAVTHRLVDRRPQVAVVDVLPRAIDHVGAHAGRIADRLGREIHAHLAFAERRGWIRVGPAHAQRHQAHLPRRAAHADPVVGKGPHQARDLGAVPGEVVRIVVRVAAVLAVPVVAVGQGGVEIHEIPTVDVVHEPVAVVVHAGHSPLLGPVGPDLTARSCVRAAEVGVIGQHPGIDDRDHDRRVAGRHVPRLGRMEIAARRLVEPVGARPQGIVGRRAGHRHDGDRLSARHPGGRAEASQGIFELQSTREMGDIKGGEVRVVRARRWGCFAQELGLEPHAAHAADDRIDVGNAKPVAPRVGRIGAAGRRGSPRREPDLEDVALVGRGRLRRATRVAHRQPQRRYGSLGVDGPERQGREDEDRQQDTHERGGASGASQ